MNKNILLIQFTKYIKVIFSSFLVITGLVVSYFITYSNYNIYTDFINQIKSQEEQNALLDTRISQLDKIKRISSTIESTDILSKQAIPSEVEIPIVMSLMQKISTDSGLKLGKLTYSGSYVSNYSESSKNVNSNAQIDQNVDLDLSNSSDSKLENTNEVTLEDAIKIQGSVVGNIDNLISFLRSVETSRKLLEVSNLSYGTTRESSDGSSLTFELRFVVSSFYKDFSNFSISPLQIDFDKYKDLIFLLNNYKYTEIDLSSVDVGKNNPFSDTSSPAINTVESSDGIDSSNNDSVDINVVEIEGTGSSSNNTSADGSQDVEADPTTNITGTLIDILNQEGVNQ